MVLILLSDILEKELPPGIHRYGRPGQERMLQGDEKTRLTHLLKFEQRFEKIEQLARRYRMRMVHGWTHEAPVMILNRAFALPKNRSAKTI